MDCHASRCVPHFVCFSNGNSRNDDKNNFAILITRWLTLCASGKPLVLTIHKKASQCNCTQWVKTHCYSGYEFSYALKNNFEILINKGFALRPFGKPLVLTSINFDSLSRKIKNPCLVIKKNLYQKEIFKMKILKTKKLFTYMVVGALSLALSVSCSNEDTTGGGSDVVQGYTHSNHPPIGSYVSVYPDAHGGLYTNTNETATVKIVDGNCNIMGKASLVSGQGQGSLDYNITVTSWYTHPNTSYLNRAGNLVENSGEATITEPTSSTLDYFNVEYDTTNQSIRVSLRTTPASGDAYYSASDLKRVE